MQLGSTAVGLKTKEGVVLAVEKRITSVLLVSSETLSFSLDSLRLNVGLVLGFCSYLFACASLPVRCPNVSFSVL